MRREKNLISILKEREILYWEEKEGWEGETKIKRLKVTLISIVCNQVSRKYRAKGYRSAWIDKRPILSRSYQSIAEQRKWMRARDCPLVRSRRTAIPTDVTSDRCDSPVVRTPRSLRSRSPTRKIKSRIARNAISLTCNGDDSTISRSRPSDTFQSDESWIGDSAKA